MTPEEKLLRAIFGEKASDVRDTSLRVPRACRHDRGSAGVQPPRRDKDERALAIEREEIERLAKDRDDEQAILDRNVYSRPRRALGEPPGHRRPKGVQEGHQDHARRCSMSIRVRKVDVRVPQRQADGRNRGDAEAVRRSRRRASSSASSTRSRSCSAAMNCRPA